MSSRELGNLLLLVLGGYVGLALLFPAQAAEVGVLKFDTLPVDDGTPITQGFTAGVHSAIDFGCPFGSALFNVAAGTVVQVHDDIAGDSGRFVIVKGSGILSEVAWSYSHLEQIDVKEGQELTAGDLIGLSGNSGFTCSSGVCAENAAGELGAHLHFAVLTLPGFNFTDPTPFLPLNQGGE